MTTKQAIRFQINNKRLEIVMTTAFADKFSPMEQERFLLLALAALQIKAVDMVVFEPVTKDAEGNNYQVRAAGYDLETDSELDEKTVLKRFSMERKKTVWFKLDNYGGHYVGTLMFPSDY